MARNEVLSSKDLNFDPKSFKLWNKATQKYYHPGKMSFVQLKLQGSLNWTEDFSLKFICLVDSSRIKSFIRKLARVFKTQVGCTQGVRSKLCLLPNFAVLHKKQRFVLSSVKTQTYELQILNIIYFNCHLLTNTAIIRSNRIWADLVQHVLTQLKESENILAYFYTRTRVHRTRN